MKNTFLILIVFAFFNTQAQESKEAKKATKLFSKGKVEKAINLLEETIESKPTDELWDLLVTMSYKKYLFTKQLFDQQIQNILAKALSGEQTTFDLSIDYAGDYNYLIEKCKDAQLYTQSNVAPILIRSLEVDYSPDTAISKEAKELFSTGEQYFRAGRYSQARENYQKAFELEPNYYAAKLYTGDAYYAMKSYDSAIVYFNMAKEQCSDLLEPRKYLVDAYGRNNQFDESIKECIDGICVYPDPSMYAKLEDLYKIGDRTLNMHWIPRGSRIVYHGSNLESTSHPQWSVYQSALKDLGKMVDTTGIINKENRFTRSKYLEVYAWEKMLNSTDNLPSDLKFAKEMMDAGYLDCYVFLSQFHYDLYPQFKDFVSNNKPRIEKFINEHLVTQSNL
ncbi:MAG: tetratricopeptide repeat protein [Flavobacteriales bacterium]|nr:tetratricopeptide repeat protein [Flavobacteriales bacterium]